MSLEENFDIGFTAALALKEKQIQQSYRPIIGIHKWFARRPGTLFRSLLLAEFVEDEPIASSFFRSHKLAGVIADPFAGGGTPTFEANRLGLGVIATDVNPMAYWIVRQGLAQLDLDAFAEYAAQVAADVDESIGHLYKTDCGQCGRAADVKYFLWVKVQTCPNCDTDNDLFPGFLLAENVRHPAYVFACGECGELNELDNRPSVRFPHNCSRCANPFPVEGPARRGRIECRSCEQAFVYPPKPATEPPRHRLWGIEYHCVDCKPSHRGRFFKSPDAADMARVSAAAAFLEIERDSLDFPDDPIPMGDESTRLHRWGYRCYAQMFNDRQLLGLGLLLRRIRAVENEEVRHALLTVFSDILRYQNMLCRYDTYALKCQDIFSVHGFPVGLVQCENSLLGIAKIGSGAFRHFVEKYLRAKDYCVRPFETRQRNGRKQTVSIAGEHIGASLVDRMPKDHAREAQLSAATATSIPLAPGSLDGVFTDPPYFDAVQYAELMDFCFVWLRIGLRSDVAAFRRDSTRHPEELTGNTTLGRDLTHFALGLADVFSHYASALKPGAPFVFTYHHNDPVAYAPLVVAILDAGLDCTATLPAPGEMGASLHIAGTTSSVLDSVFVCRASVAAVNDDTIEDSLRRDTAALSSAGLRLTRGDLKCLTSGHVARFATNRLRARWDKSLPAAERLLIARAFLSNTALELDSSVIGELIAGLPEVDPIPTLWPAIDVA